MGLQLIYLDTNTWKAITDVRRGKSNVTDEMRTFVQAVDRSLESGTFIFPIGLPTFYELDAMVDPKTHAELDKIVDSMSQSYCIAEYMGLFEEEIGRLANNDYSVRLDRGEFLISPMELFGIMDAGEHPMTRFVDKNAFRKASYDLMSEVPFSQVLEMSRNAPGDKWNNSKLTDFFNAGKKDNPIANLQEAMLAEFVGLIDVYCEASNQTQIPRTTRFELAGRGLIHWHQNPTSQAFPTLRTLVCLHGLLRFDVQRRYHHGDSIDFLTATSALPTASAFFTDRKLATLLEDKNLAALRSAFPCKVIAGFGAMANHLDAIQTKTEGST